MAWFLTKPSTLATKFPVFHPEVRYRNKGKFICLNIKCAVEGEIHMTNDHNFVQSNTNLLHGNSKARASRETHSVVARPFLFAVLAP